MFFTFYETNYYANIKTIVKKLKLLFIFVFVNNLFIFLDFIEFVKNFILGDIGFPGLPGETGLRGIDGKRGKFFFI